ncbi:MAG TPA: HAD domain-containing protein [Kribbellaceae bacterium]|nr:HAD domain-containing protein [Kribbellaceae bacterium]
MPGLGQFQRHWVFPLWLPHRLSLNPHHGGMLTGLAEAVGAELVWATYWRNRANTWVAPRVGLPALRFVPIPTRFRFRRRSSPARWKAQHVAAWIGSTPFVWFEDDPEIPAMLAATAGIGRHLVVTVDPARGLTRDHIESARAWLLDFAH